MFLSFEYEETFSIPLIRDKQHHCDICVAKQHLSRQDIDLSPLSRLPQFIITCYNII